MADSTATLELRILGADKAAAEVSKFEQKTTRSMTAAESSVAKSLGNMIAQYASMAVAVQKTIKVLSSGVEFNKFVENTTMSFSVMMKSADAAKSQMKDLYDFAVNSPLTFKETASSAKQLMAYGFEAKQLVPTMKRLGAVAIATGHSLDDISYIYGTLKSQGRAYSRDLMQFGMRGIPIYEELAKVMGVGADKIQKMASEGKIGFAEVEKAFQNMTTNGGRFAGILEGYMETLTGKTAMLSDMWEKSSGKMTVGIFEQMKVGVAGLTAALEDEGMQNFFATLSVDLGHIAEVLVKVLLGFIKLVPLLSVFLKIWVTFMALKVASMGLALIPKLLFSIGDMAVKAAIGLQGLALSTAGATTAFASMTTGVQLLSGAMVAFAIANPWLVALLAIAAVGGTLLTIQHVNADKARESEDASVRAKQFERDIKAGSSSNVGYSGMVAQVLPQEVAKLAKEYTLANTVVADILIAQKQLSRAVWDTYTATKAYSDQLKALGGAQASRVKEKSYPEMQKEFLSGLTGNDIKSYADESGSLIGSTMGTRGANDYIASFAAKMKADEAIYGKAFTPDMRDSNLKEEVKALYASLEAGAAIPNLFKDTGFDETTIARIIEINKLLDATGKKIKAIVPYLNASMEAMNKLTYASPDNTGIERAYDVKARKDSMEAAKEEQRLIMVGINKTYFEKIELAKKESAVATDLAEKMSKDISAWYREPLKSHSLDEQIALEASYEKAKSMGVAKFQDAVMLEEELARIRIKFQADADEQIAAARFASMAGGEGAYWTGLQAEASNAKDSGSTTGQILATAQGSMQGTEMGSMAAGADPMTMLIIGAMNFLTSIENVTKVLNPITTLFEAMRPILEPLINNILQPMVDVLEMVGEVIAAIITPFLGVQKILTTLIYLVLTPFIAILQMVGAVFTWLYDKIIVPIANAFVKIVNGVIKALNKIPGVHIRYMDALQTTTEMMMDLSNVVAGLKDALSATISYLAGKLNDMIDAQIGSLQDLYEVGALSGSEYAAKTDKVNAYRIDTEKQLVSLADQQLSTMQDVFNRLTQLYAVQKIVENSGWTDQRVIDYLKLFGIATTATPTPVVPDAPDAGGGAEASTAPSDLDNAKTGAAVGAVIGSFVPVVGTIIGAALGGTIGYFSDEIKNVTKTVAKAFDWGWWDVGTPEIMNTGPAIVHKGEGIIPATFMEGIRSGELSLSSGDKAPSGGSVNVYVTVQGSVQTEKDLASSIANQIFTQRSRGILTV